MRTVAASLALLAALGGCRNEPDFDERFEKAQKDIEKTAREIERDLEKARKDAAEASPSPDPQTGDSEPADDAA